MNEQQKELIHFAQTAHGLESTARLKLILLAAGAKPATFFPLKINPKNIEEKRHLELHLHGNNLVFLAGKPRAYEEIVNVHKNIVQWRINGSWYGYDVFKDKKHAGMFLNYLSLVKHQQHARADRTAGMLYNYPACCVEHYIREHSLAFLRKNYTPYSYYKHLHERERAFPFLQHIPCSRRCAKSKKLNAQYATVVKKHAPQFFKAFSSAKKYTADVVVDTESELLQDRAYGLQSTETVFPVKDGHEYSLITLKPFEGHYYLLSHLTKKTLQRGTVFPATIRTCYQYADAVLGKPKRTVKNLHHERHFILP